MTFYYDNLLNNHNYTAKPNVVWAADIISFELTGGKKIYVYLYIDIFTNRVIVSLFRTKVIQTNDIIKKLNQAIDKRLPIKPVRKDNPVAERFMITFKEYKINDRTFQEELFYQIVLIKLHLIMKII